MLQKLKKRLRSAISKHNLKCTGLRLDVVAHVCILRRMEQEYCSRFKASLSQEIKQTNKRDQFQGKEPEMKNAGHF